MGEVSTDPQPLALPTLSDPPPPGSRTVTTDDGVPLHVEVDGVADAPVTVVFSHGFTARLAATWARSSTPPRPRGRSCSPGTRWAA
jgi:hypothetical protein